MIFKINELIKSDVKSVRDVGHILFDSYDKQISTDNLEKIAQAMIELDKELDENKNSWESGYEYGKEEGHEDGKADGYEDGYKIGKAEGITLGKQQALDELQNVEEVEDDSIIEIRIEGQIRNYMDIYSRPGTKVRFMNKGGYDSEAPHAIKVGLVEGEVYTIARIEVDRSSSEVFLKGFKNSFNTCMFDVVEEENEND